MEIDKIDIDSFTRSGDERKYWDGRKNKIIRYYFYTQRGLELLNEFRYIFMVIIAIYYAMKVDNILLIPLMFALCLPILIVLGWFSTHHMKKVMEWINIKFATHWGLYSYRLQEEQLKVLYEIRDDLKKGGENEVDNSCANEEQAAVSC